MFYEVKLAEGDKGFNMFNKHYHLYFSIHPELRFVWRGQWLPGGCSSYPWDSRLLTYWQFGFIRFGYWINWYKGQKWIDFTYR